MYTKDDERRFHFLLFNLDDNIPPSIGSSRTFISAVVPANFAHAFGMESILSSRESVVW